MMFWSSAVLTGNRTRGYVQRLARTFWSSAVLTGNRTLRLPMFILLSFGAVPF